MPGLKAPLSQEIIVDSDSDLSPVNTKAAAVKKPASILRKSNQSPKPRSDATTTKKRNHDSPNATFTTPTVSQAAVPKSRLNQGQDRSRSELHSRGSASDEDTDESGSNDSASDEEPSRGASYVASVAVTMALLLPAMIDRPQSDNLTSSSNLQNSSNKEALHDKQIWYITAPASVPVSLIEEVSKCEVAEGASILSYKNAEYGLIAEPDTKHEGKLLLVPSPEHNDYRPSGVRIEKSLHLQQLVKRPDSTQRNAALSHEGITAPKTHVKVVRQQPEGLRMRYQPFGERSPSEDEDTDEAPRFKLPPMVSIERSPRAEKTSADKRSLSSSDAQMKETKSPEKAKLTSDLSEVLSQAQGSPFNEVVERIRHESQFDYRLSSGPIPVEASEDMTKRRAEKKRKTETRDDDSNQASERRHEHSQSTTSESMQMAANGVEGIHQPTPQAASLKKKRKKRKAEATDDA
ncbi:MAG: hypothetical protein Q9221_008841 [Calogaya cf. arnoldii]